MNILFDFEITETPTSTTPEATTAMAELREFARHKLGVLQDEIDKYQEGIIVLSVLGTIKTAPLGLTVFNYPEDLAEKIKTLLTEEDLAYIECVAEEKIAIISE